MTILTFDWNDNSGDHIFIEYNDNNGNETLSIFSDLNNTGVQRQRLIFVTTSLYGRNPITRVVYVILSPTTNISDEL